MHNHTNFDFETNRGNASSLSDLTNLSDILVHDRRFCADLEKGIRALKNPLFPKIYNPLLRICTNFQMIISPKLFVCFIQDMHQWKALKVYFTPKANLNRFSFHITMNFSNYQFSHYFSIISLYFICFGLLLATNALNVN